MSIAYYYWYLTEQKVYYAHKKRLYIPWKYIQCERLNMNETLLQQREAISVRYRARKWYDLDNFDSVVKNLQSVMQIRF